VPPVDSAKETSSEGEPAGLAPEAGGFRDWWPASLPLEPDAEPVGLPGSDGNLFIGGFLDS